MSELDEKINFLESRQYLEKCNVMLLNCFRLERKWMSVELVYSSNLINLACYKKRAINFAKILSAVIYLKIKAEGKFRTMLY